MLVVEKIFDRMNKIDRIILNILLILSKFFCLWFSQKKSVFDRGKDLVA